MKAALYDTAPEHYPPAVKAIQYVECPHCHHEVMARPDGKCIACGKSRSDASAVDPDLTMLTIDNVHALPACCFCCGSETRRMQGFTWNFRISPFALPPWMIPFVALMSFLPGSQYRTSEHVRLPVCKACAKPARRVRPLSVASGLDCRLLVHREFRRRFEAINGKARLEWEADLRPSTSPIGVAAPVEGVVIRT